MHDTRRVRRRQRVGHLDRVVERLVQPQSFAGDQLVQRLAGHKLHGNEIGGVPFRPGLADIVDGDDVRMVERGGGPGFQDEAPLALGIAHLCGRQKLERHEAVQARVAGFPDDTHSAAAQLLDDAVMRDGPADHKTGAFLLGGCGRLLRLSHPMHPLWVELYRRADRGQGQGPGAGSGGASLMRTPTSLPCGRSSSIIPPASVTASSTSSSSISTW